MSFSSRSAGYAADVTCFKHVILAI